MVYVVFVALAVAVAAVGVLLAVWLPWRRLVRRRVVVVLDSERVIEGLLWARRGPLLILRDAKVHEAGRQVPADGELVVERGRIEWFQVVR